VRLCSVMSRKLARRYRFSRMAMGTHPASTSTVLPSFVRNAVSSLIRGAFGEDARHGRLHLGGFAPCEQAVNGKLQEIAPRVAEERARRFVRVGDSTIRLHHNDRVERLGEEESETLFALAQRLLGHVPVRYVAHVLYHARQRALPVPDREAEDLQPRGSLAVGLPAGTIAWRSFPSGAFGEPGTPRTAWRGPGTVRSTSGPPTACAGSTSSSSPGSFRGW